MKTRFLLILSALFLITACKKKSDDSNRITMKVHPYLSETDNYYYVDFMVGPGDVNVNWGDGRTEHFSSSVTDIRHHYLDSGTYTVTITSSNIKRFYTSNLQVDDIDIRSCSDLRSISSVNGNLGALDASNCEYIRTIEIDRNNFSAEALNNLFKSLPQHEEGYQASLYISNNPGAETCDKSIAENKGWKFR